MTYKFIFKTVIFFALLASYTQAQVIRVAVLPFENMDGLLEANVWSYDLQDTVYKSLLEVDSEAKHYELVAPDEIEDVVAELNLDPSNPQYKSDVWKAVNMLKVKKVVMGNFNIQDGKYLINVYVYDAKMKLADPKNQIRDIFKDEDKIMTAIPEIIEAILPAIKK